MAVPGRRRLAVQPVGARGTRKVQTLDGERIVRPTVDSLVRLRTRKVQKRVVIRFKR